MKDRRIEIAQGARALGKPLSEQQLDQLIHYLKLLTRWNRSYNLVGTSSEEELVRKHLLDSLAVAPYVNIGPVLDVGSGAGLPGIPLAITLPELSFTLLDANGKKIRFLRQLVIELDLCNVQVIQSRVEQYQPSHAPATVLCRAFAPIEQALIQLLDVCAPQGQVLIMLGGPKEVKVPVKGLAELNTIEIQVPGLSDERHLLVATKV